MTRRDVERLTDVLAAMDAIRSHLDRGGLEDGLVYDAVRARLIEIGQAVKGVGGDVPNRAPEIPWGDVAGMRDRLAHRYFDTSHAGGLVKAALTRNMSKALKQLAASRAM